MDHVVPNNERRAHDPVSDQPHIVADAHGGTPLLRRSSDDAEKARREM